MMQTGEAAYLHATSFIPERWYARPELVLDQGAFAPFSLGTAQDLRSLRSWFPC